MSRRGINVNTEALYSAALERDAAEEQAEEERPIIKAGFTPKFRNTKVNKAGEVVKPGTNPQPTIGKRDQYYSSTVQANLASKRLEEQIRKAALKKIGY